MTRRALHLAMLALACLSGSAWASPPGLTARPATGLKSQVPPDRAMISVTVSASQSPATVRPGTADVSLMTINISSIHLLQIRLTALRLTNQTTGPGTQAQKDAELGQARLYRDDGDGIFEPGQDVLVLQRSAASGRIDFSPISVPVPGLGSVQLLVVTTVPLVARDTDALDLSIQGPSDMTFDTGTGFGNSWPLAPPGAFLVNGMSAAQIGVDPVGPSNILAGSVRNLAFEVLLPCNGYQADQLEKLIVVNGGTALSGGDITRIEAWIDDGNGTFDPALDQNLGTLAFTGGNRWQITGLTRPVPTTGLRVFLTVDVNDLANEGRTVQLSLPTLPDAGVGMVSDNDGPLDAPVGNPFARAISTADRVTLTAALLPPQVVSPGEGSNPIFQLVATNSYATGRTLTGLAFTNATTGPGTPAQRDAEIAVLTLRADGDGDGALDDPWVDPVLATGFFSAGEAAFTGLDVSLPAGTSRFLFLIADLSLTEATDGDVLSTVIPAPLDVSFAEPTHLVASWPVDSRAQATIDGLVTAQVTNVGAPVASLGPGEGPALALDVIVPRNGYATDLLERLELVNRGTAGPSDIAELRLWRDGGDGSFSAGTGDDRDLGLATWQGDRWQSAALAETLAMNGARLFAAFIVSGTPTDSATIRLAIPIGGIANASENDGPIDAEIENPHPALLSNSPLLAGLETIPGVSAVGQTVQVLMVVRNVGSETLLSVTPSALAASGSGSFGPLSGPTPASLDLAPAAADTFAWTFTATGAGEVSLSGHADGTGSPSGTPRRSLGVSSNVHHVFSQAVQLGLTADSSMPEAVNRGQSDVVPLTFTFTNAAGPDVSPVRLLGLRVRLEDQGAVGIVPSQLLSRVVVNQGTTVYLVKTTLESSGAEVDLTLASPLVIGAGESAALTLRMDLSASTTVPNFRVAVSDSTWFVAVDANSGAPVTVELQGAGYPIRSGVARVVAAPTELDVARVAGPGVRAAPGQDNLPLLTLRLTNPGLDGITSDVRVFSLAVSLSDTNGGPLASLATHLRRVRVATAFQTLVTRTLSPADGGSVSLILSPPLGVPVNAPLDLFVSGDLAFDAPLGAFRMRLGDSTTFDARDDNTRDPVPVLYASNPLTGPDVIVESRADTLRAQGTPRLPSTVSVGDTGIVALTFRLRHPDSAGAARIRVDRLTVHCRDEARRPLSPGAYLDRLRLLWNGVQVANVPDPPVGGGTVEMPLPGLLLEPADTATVDLIMDVSATAPVGFLELMIFETGWILSDANLGLPVVLEPESGAELPMVSGLTRLESPARDLTVGLASRMPVMLAPDGATVSAGVLSFAIATPGTSDTLAIDSLTVRAASRASQPLTVGSGAARVQAYVGSTLWAQSAPLSPSDTLAVLVAGVPLAIPPGAPVEVELRFATASVTVPASFRLGLDASDVGVVQPGSALLQVRVSPAPGQVFPLWTAAGGFGVTSLKESYSNFPNPFAAGREATSFVFYLPRPGGVTLRIWTPGGERVATVIDGTSHPAGIHQGDAWGGRNGRGDVVRNGVYVAELVVRFDDGSSERLLRKVAVLR